jgi:sugar lactone lactonase YvrE
VPISIEALDAPACRLGEGAVWDEAEQALYYVDILGQEIRRYDPATGAERRWPTDEPVGCIALREAGGAVAGLQSGLYAFDLDTGAATLIASPEADRPGNRFNDAAVDPRGRWWAGTVGMPAPVEGAAAFYRLDPDLSCTRMIDGITTTNGLAFSPDGRTMYFSDSFPAIRTIWACDYDADTGTPSRRRVFFDTRAVAGRPDGAAVDADGCYWMAGVGGWQLVRLTPAGAVDRIVEVPVERPSRPCFGGPDLATLFVTTIAVDTTPGTEQPLAGRVLAIEGLGVQGFALPRFAG